MVASPPQALARVLCGAWLAVIAGWCTACASDALLDERRGEPPAQQQSALSTYGDTRAWSRKPPGLDPVDVPAFVAVTFDDNFVSGLGDVSGGMTWATTFFEALRNPAGSGFAPTFDGALARTTFYDNCVYLQDEGTKKSWITARTAGHEIANHTVNHPQGAAFTAQDWTDEIAPCTAALSRADSGVGVSVDDVQGFRAPYLAYSSELFGALKQQGLWYDSSVQSCWGNGDDGKACAWPYTLEQGSPDAVELAAKLATPAVPPSAGLWELTPSALFVPPDELATTYGFEPGLRQRVPTNMPAPSFYEPATGRIAPLDVTLWVDAGLSAPEVLATLKYTLDLRLQGNRAPFIFIGHTHVYASNYGAAPKAPEASVRQRALEDFVRYALSKPVVRVRPVKDIMAWMRHPEPLNGVVTALPTSGGTGGSGAGNAGAAGIGGAGGAAAVGGAANLAGAGATGGGATNASKPSNAPSPTPDASCSYTTHARETEHGTDTNARVVLLLLALTALARRRKMAILGPTVRFIVSLPLARPESLPLASSSGSHAWPEPRI